MLVLGLAFLGPACGTTVAGENAVAARNGPTRQRPAASLKLGRVADSVVDPRALNFPSGPWGPAINGQAFQQDGVASHKGYQYATYYDADRRLCVARRKLPAADWEVIRFEDYRIGEHNDIHNVATLGVCPGDGTIHLAFDHHCGPLHYRVSGRHAATRPAEVSSKAPAAAASSDDPLPRATIHAPIPTAANTTTAANPITHRGRLAGATGIIPVGVIPALEVCNASNWARTPSAVCQRSADLFARHFITVSARSGGTVSRYFVTGSAA